MTPEQQKQIEKLIETGKLISQQEVYASPIQKDDYDLEFTTIGFEDVSEKPFPNHCEGTLMEVWEHDFPGYSEFVTKAINSRPAIAALYAENKTLREALNEFPVDCDYARAEDYRTAVLDWLKTLKGEE